MNSQKGTKINRLITKWPAGTVALYEWLRAEGMYRQLVDRYVQSGWLKRIGRGAFVRLGEQVDWTGGLYALQKHKKLRIHVAGITALQLQGYAYYIPIGSYFNVHLQGSRGTKLPRWFSDYPWKNKIKFRTSSIFGVYLHDSFVTIKRKDYEILVSSPERAILELLQAIPKDESFEHARSIMEGLTTLRPKNLQTLLEKCQSVKVKRLFLFFGEYCNHDWFKRINIDKIDLGTGKRVVAIDGQLDSKYLITVPKDFYRDETIGL